MHLRDAGLNVVTPTNWLEAQITARQYDRGEPIHRFTLGITRRHREYSPPCTCSLVMLAAFTHNVWVEPLAGHIAIWQDL